MAVIESYQGLPLFRDGIVIQSADGTYWKVYVDDSGTLVIEELI